MILEDVVREVPDVAAEVLRDVVRVVEQPREVEPRCVVERPPGGALELLATYVRAVAGVRSVGGEHRLLRLGEDAVEASEHGEGRSTIVTTNLAFSEWVQVFGDEKLTTALLDRLGHHAQILTTRGQSYRTRHAHRAPEDRVHQAGGGA